MNKKSRGVSIQSGTAIVFCVIFSAILATNVFADGTEILGVPSIPIAEGNGIVLAGVGLEDTQPGTISINVPDNVNIVQVLLYWGGAVTSNNPTDSTIMVEGTEITGSLIGGPAFFFSAFGKDFYYSNYRADITELGLVTSGLNLLDISGLDNKDADGNGENSGAGILIIYDDDSVTSDIQIKDGLDLAFIGFPDPRRATVPQTFSFSQEDIERTAILDIFAGSVGQEGNRTSIIRVNVDGVITDFPNLLASVDSDLWDTLTIPIVIPAGASSMTVEIISGDGTGDPASLNWIGAAFSLETIESGTGRFTGGGHQIRVDGVRITRGLTIHCDLLLSNNLEVNWQGNQFHMTEHLVTVECSDDPNIIQFPPAAPLDTLVGVGTGRYNGADGYTIVFTLVDAGEPGREDKASILIYETANPSNTVLDVPLQILDGGNLQAHEDQPHRN